MRNLLPPGHRRLALQLMAAGGLATLMSGCSSDVTRLTDPFSNPFASNDEAPVAQARPHHVASADVIPAGRMPPVSSQALAPRPAPSVAYNTGVSRETTGSIEPGPIRTAGGASYGNWTTNGGTPIVVADGESADVLAQRYGVPSSALLQVNGLHAAGDVRPGAHITIPVYSASVAARPEHVAQAAPARVEERRIVTHGVAAARPVPERVAQASGKWVAGPAPARTVAAAPGRVISAQAVAPAPVAHLRPGQDAKSALQTKVAATPAPKAAPLQKVAVAKLAPAAVAVPAPIPGPKSAVKAAPLAAARPQAQTTEAKVAVEPTPAGPAASPTASADNNPEFRWPARGRIIQAFKGGSGGNDGINIAVPEGTPVKAAEGGVVAYAGSELKGYGNLVLIRHPNGFVSAYANNGSIDVKRGETVKRGQEIAKSGQSGNVSSPQLHFELRKGSTPVDPTQYLAGL